MGGGSILVAETKNYQWWLPYSCSNYPITYHDLYVMNKDTEQEISTGGYFREDDKESHAQYRELQTALDELTMENALRGNWKAMDKSQIALGDMYARMAKAERDFSYWKDRALRAEGQLSQIRDAIREVERRKEAKED